MKIKLLFLSFFLGLFFCNGAEAAENKAVACAKIIDAISRVMADGKELAPDGLIPPNSPVTTDETGKACIKMPDGTLITVDSDSEFSLLPNDAGEGKGGLIFRLDRGAAKIEPGEGKGDDGTATLIHTPQAVVDPRGATLGIQSILDETLVFLEKIRDVGAVVQDIVSGAQSVLEKVGNVIDMLKGNMTEKPATRMERNFFKNIADGLKTREKTGQKAQAAQSQADPSRRYSGVWKAQVPLSCIWKKSGGIGRGTMTGEVAVTIGDIIREVKLSTYPGNVHLPVQASDDKGLEVQVKNVTFPVMKGGKLVPAVIPQGVALVSPESGIVRLNLAQGKVNLGLMFQIGSDNTAHGVFINSNIVERKTASGIDVSFDGRCQDPQQVIFRRQD